MGYYNSQGRTWRCRFSWTANFGKMAKFDTVLTYLIMGRTMTAIILRVTFPSTIVTPVINRKGSALHTRISGIGEHVFSNSSSSDNINRISNHIFSHSSSSSSSRSNLRGIWLSSVSLFQSSSTLCSFLEIRRIIFKQFGTYHRRLKATYKGIADRFIPVSSSSNIPEATVSDKAIQGLKILVYGFIFLLWACRK